MSQISTERVLVVPSAELDRLGRFQGFSGEAERLSPACSSPSWHSSGPGPRSRANRTSSRSSPTSSSAAATRSSATPGGPSRESRDCIASARSASGDTSPRLTPAAGPTSTPTRSPCAASWTRRSSSTAAAKSGDVGIINDDATPVGQVHLGVVHLYELQRPDVTPKEAGLAEAEFVRLADIQARRNQFKSWSQICIDSFLRAG